MIETNDGLFKEKYSLILLALSTGRELPFCTTVTWGAGLSSVTKYTTYPVRGGRLGGI